MGCSITLKIVLLAARAIMPTCPRVHCLKTRVTHRLVRSISIKTLRVRCTLIVALLSGFVSVLLTSIPTMIQWARKLLTYFYYYSVLLVNNRNTTGRLFLYLGSWFDKLTATGQHTLFTLNRLMVSLGELLAPETGTLRLTTIHNNFSCTKLYLLDFISYFFLNFTTLILVANLSKSASLWRKCRE